MPHLTYVGDATIGEESNIGAASVFVNYDGVRKHRTVVGSHVRTGSDTMFIAPLHVGDGAYTGAGTVLRHDVPAGGAGGVGRATAHHRRLGREDPAGYTAAEAAAAVPLAALRPTEPDDGRTTAAGGPAR